MPKILGELLHSSFSEEKYRHRMVKDEMRENRIRPQSPGNSLHLVLFHDSVEHMLLSHLSQVQVGPDYTNTREGLRLARHILDRQ
jgi:uncharacterized protein with von Willebrand factor type A (vWA) domain